MQKHWWQSSAIVGAVGVAVSIVTSPAVVNAVPAKYSWIAGAIFYAVNQYGQRTATAKNGNGQ